MKGPELGIQTRLNFGQFNKRRMHFQIICIYVLTKHNCLHLSFEPQISCVGKMCPQIWFCLFMVRCTTLKQFNSLTTIHAFRCLSGRQVKHQTVHSAKSRDRFPALTRNFIFAFSRSCRIFTIWCKKTLFVKQFRPPFSMLYNLVYLYYKECDQ